MTIREELELRLLDLQTLALCLPPPKATTRWPPEERDRAMYDGYAIRTIYWQAAVIRQLTAAQDAPE